MSVCDHSCEQGITAIASGVEVEPACNKASISFHSSMGFAEAGERPEGGAPFFGIRQLPIYIYMPLRRAS